MTKQSRKSILCPNCRKLISADESVCPHCGTSRPGAWYKNNIWTQGFGSADQLIKTIIYVNVGMYILALLFTPLSPGLSLSPFGFLSPKGGSLLLLGATGTLPIDQYHRWWTLISANYLHGSLLHIVFNMIALRQISPMVTSEYGNYRMFAIYTISGVAGFLVSYLAGVAFTIGASAAVCGLIGAVIYYSWSRGGAYGQMVFRQISGWLIGLFLIGLFLPGINNWGHGGGIAAGFLLGFLLQYSERSREGVFHKFLAGGCVLLTVAVLAWAVFTGIYIRIGGF